MQYTKNMVKAIYSMRIRNWTVSLKVERILDMDVAEERYLYGPPVTLKGGVTRRSVTRSIAKCYFYITSTEKTKVTLN